MRQFLRGLYAKWNRARPGSQTFKQFRAAIRDGKIRITFGDDKKAAE
jgi:hypothetical protein